MIASIHVAITQPLRLWFALRDAICDRIVHNAHLIKLGSESIRKKESFDERKEPGEIVGASVAGRVIGMDLWNR
jgi:hypothetical protein